MRQAPTNFSQVTRSGGPDDGPEALRIGFVSEPIVDLFYFGERTHYSECLARIVLGDGRILMPVDFIGDLEASGDIGFLDAAIVDLVLDALEREPNSNLGCNISPATLASETSWGMVMHLLGRRPQLAHRLVLEITESAPLDEIAAAPVRLTDAQALGCRIAIDDFGAGGATMRHLHGIKLDWDIVKIDRSCFSLVLPPSSERDGLRGILELASHIAPTVIVEGIETSEHFDVAYSSGVRWGQGFFFSRPSALRQSKKLDGVHGDQLVASLLRNGVTRVRTKNDGPHGAIAHRISDRSSSSYRRWLCSLFSSSSDGGR